MSRPQCLFALIALSAGAVYSWDIAVTTNNHRLEFYSNQTKTHNEGEQFRDLTALAYDAVYNMLLFVDKHSDNASIFSYHLATKKYQSLVRRRSNENIQGLAFDPVKSILFWTDYDERSIFWISLRPGSKNDIYGNLLIKMDSEIPRAIAVDSCRGYIYWTNTNIANATIERAKFDGSEREVIVSKDIYMPVSVAVDQLTKKLYWADDKEGIHYSIESSDLDGKNRNTLLVGTHHQPNALAVSKDYLYWVDWGYKSVWKLPKNATRDAEPEELIAFHNEELYGIVANYPIEDQIRGTSECEALSRLSENKTAINDTFSVPPDVGLFCVHGVKVKGKLECKCKPGYTGERCDISVCQNFCLQGDCSFTNDGQPSCRCKHGYTGERCEINLCNEYCLNNGLCTLDEDHIRVCKCSEEYEGSRCEKIKDASIPAPVLNVSETSNCTQNQNTTKPSMGYSSEHLNTADGDFVGPSCNDDWDSVKNPVIMVLSILCGMLFIACAVLITKILQLKKRPRIKKRIIVNKNVTPMTARPDQCEITMENCCNMNICETPCFEPRSTIRPTLLDSKPGKEEKKNLMTNMEYPDDY